MSLLYVLTVEFVGLEHRSELAHLHRIGVPREVAVGLFEHVRVLGDGALVLLMQFVGGESVLLAEVTDAVHLRALALFDAIECFRRFYGQSDLAVRAEDIEVCP